MENKTINKKTTILKIILLAALAAFLVFAFVQRDNFIKSVTYFDGNELTEDLPTEGVISLAGNQEVTETFTAKYNTLNTVELVFQNPDKQEATGEIGVKILDSNGDKVCGISIDASEVENDSTFPFEFSGNMDQLNSSKVLDEYEATDTTSEKIKLKKGDEYTVVITSKDVKSPGKIGVYTANSEKAKLAMSISYWKFLIPVFGVFVFFTLVAAAIVCLPFERIEATINRRRSEKHKKEIELNKLVLRIMFFLTPLVSYAILSKIADDTLTRTVKHLFTLEGVLNIFIIGLIWWTVYVICNRTKWTIIITTAMTFAFGLANYLLYEFRGSQLTATDLKFATTGFGVMSNYSMVVDKACLWAIMISLIWVCIALLFKDYKGLSLKQRILPLVILVVWGVGFNQAIFQSSMLKDHKIIISGFSPDYNYRTYGYALAFTVTVTTLNIEKPSDYSVAEVEKIAEEYQSDELSVSDEATETQPNVIAIMNESFADLSALGDVPTNKDYMPFVHSLTENTVKGTMHSSVFGARTANSEFEFLTGFTCSFLPYGSMAYNGHIKEGTPNLTTVLESEGYGGNIAFHPGKRDSYSRDTVYPNLGFEKHIALDDLENPGLLRAYVSDEYDYEVVTDEYEEYKDSGAKSPFYIFNVTIQNHANYTSAEGEVDAGIELLRDDIKYQNSVNYLNLIKKSDEAFQGLVEYFEDVEEPTVIVLFGDHQPQFGSFVYENLFNSDEDGVSFEETESKYQVPFVIWANYDIEEEEGVELSANYLYSYMLKATGGQMTGYNKYLMDLYQEVPVITTVGYMDKEGNLYKDGEESEYSDLIEQYRCVQYNGLADIENRVDSLFELKEK